MIVIADDITGAAEIAGIAFSRGHQVRLVCEGTKETRTTREPRMTRMTRETRMTRMTRETSMTRETRMTWMTSPTSATSAPSVPPSNLFVLATDTRSMSASEAVSTTRHLAASLPAQRLFKKTDSALRGHVVAELRALLEATPYRRAVFVPANPSKGRIIRQGTYYIHGTPIHQTDFSFDPEFPARTSFLRERFPEAEAAGILMPDAESLDDIRRIVRDYDDGQTLFAGAADLFTALCAETGDSPQQNDTDTSGSRLIVCGSTQSKPIDCGLPVIPMPLAVYDGEQEAMEWLQSIPADLTSLILTIPHRHRTGKDIAVHCRTVMSEVTQGLVARHCPHQLIIEGGATAWATLQALEWTQFDITRQIAPGVVQMRAASGTLVTLKPGSYPWGNLF